jgi:hypothetical protein
MVLRILIVTILNCRWDNRRFCSDVWRAILECNLLLTEICFVCVVLKCDHYQQSDDFLCLFYSVLLDSNNDTADKHLFRLLLKQPLCY